MAKEAKKKLPQFTTPRGTFVYPKLTEPDYGTKDYPKPDGEYSLKLRMSREDAEAFVNRKNKDGVSVQSLYDDAMREAEAAFAELKVETRKKLGAVKPNELYTVLYDQETEEPTGEVEFKFKMKASGETKKGPRAGTKWSRKPDLFDAKGRKIGGGVNIWGGSEGKVSFVGSPYFIPGTAAAGLRLMLGGVQVIELVSNGSRAADSYGFGQEEGFGYDPDEYRGEEEEGGDTSDSDNEGGSAAKGEEDF
ncbi:hypothetical protein ABIA22_001789 [Sinorhizobium fredii]|uniref:hypothetical protein n=1 Tax=Rhizobium fredii TaxID=380 RepID=UPI00351397BF